MKSLQNLSEGFKTLHLNIQTALKNAGLKKQRCRICGCTDDDCSGCIKRTGQPCYWVKDDLCSACQSE